MTWRSVVVMTPRVSLPKDRSADCRTIVPALYAHYTITAAMMVVMIIMIIMITISYYDAIQSGSH